MNKTQMPMPVNAYDTFQTTWRHNDMVAYRYPEHGQWVHKYLQGAYRPHYPLPACLGPVVLTADIVCVTANTPRLSRTVYR